MNKEIEYYEFTYKIPKYKIKPPLNFSEYYQIHKDEIIIDLQQENKQLKEQVQDLKADYGTIAQIERDLYKEVIEEVREFVGSEEMYNCSFEEETNKLLQILDKAKDSDD